MKTYVEIGGLRKDVKISGNMYFTCDYNCEPGLLYKMVWDGGTCLTPVLLDGKRLQSANPDFFGKELSEIFGTYSELTKEQIKSLNLSKL